MKKWSFILATMLALTVFSGNVMADDDPILCNVEINYKGQEYGGHDDASTNDEAIHDAKEEACERACRKGGDACEHDCMVHAIVKKQDCQSNPKADKSRPKGEIDCRVAIRYNGSEYHAVEHESRADKAMRDAVEEACESACFAQNNHKQCERSCRVNAEVIGSECMDRNDHVVRNEGKLPPRPADFHPAKVPPAPVAAPAPKPAPAPDKADKKGDKKGDKKADKKDDKKGDKKADKKDDKKGKK